MSSSGDQRARGGRGRGGRKREGRSTRDQADSPTTATATTDTLANQAASLKQEEQRTAANIVLQATTTTTTTKVDVDDVKPLSPRSAFLSTIDFVADHADDLIVAPRPAHSVQAEHHHTTDVAIDTDTEPEVQTMMELDIGQLPVGAVSGVSAGGSSTAHRRTTPILTKFELARVIGTRSVQLSQDAPATVDTLGETDSMRIALMEFFAGTIPITIRRFQPDGSFEDWPLADLDHAQSTVLIPPITKNYQYRL
jgi:DNA-directed RNA polymerases I, II, and III subunit RPABC2